MAWLGDQAIFLVVFAVAIVVVLLTARANAKLRAQRIAAWQHAAASSGLTLSGGYPMFSLTGPLDGVEVSVAHDYWIGHKGRRHYRHELSVPIARDVGDLVITRETLFESVGKVFGGQDVKVGDSTFDGAFVIKGSDEAKIREILDARVREALLAAQAAMPTVHVEGGRVRFTATGLADPATIVEQLRALAAVAGAFEPLPGFRTAGPSSSFGP